MATAGVVRHSEDMIGSVDRAKEDFRDYSSGTRTAVVREHYRAMRSMQTREFVDRMWVKWHSFDRARMTVRQAFDALGEYVDSSDPDLGLPNNVHALQTAEGMRSKGAPDWMVLTGLLHDFGKIMFLWGTAEDGQVGTAEGPQWALGGDTWVTGCRIPDCIVFPEFNELNPDMGHSVYSTEMGVYERGCGLKALRFAYGHDEYMAQMVAHNGSKLPAAAVGMVRYHSCYAWHTGGAYTDLMCEEDVDTLSWVRKFNEFDLYTKTEERVPEVDQLWPYYQKLVDKYLPGVLEW